MSAVAVPAAAPRRPIPRIVVWTAALLTVEVVVLGFLMAWQHGVFGGGVAPTSADFVSFYAAGKQAVAGHPAAVYDRVAHGAAEFAATRPGGQYQFFFYPPVYLLLCVPLALLPYMPAFIVFQAATLAALLWVVARIAPLARAAWFVPALAFPPVFWTLGLGQNAFLSAALLGGFTLLLDANPVLAGICLGLLCYKPQLAVLAPPVLAAGGRWRAFGSAAVTVVVLAAGSVLAFGWQPWAAYLRALPDARAIYESGRIDFAGFVTAFGAARLVGFGIRAAWIFQIAVAVLAGGWVVWIWRRGGAPAECRAALAVGVLLVSPLALLYDLMLAGLAIAWLCRAGPPASRLDSGILFACFAAPLLGWQLGTSLHIPLAFLSCAALLARCIRRAAAVSGPYHAH